MATTTTDRNTHYPVAMAYTDSKYIVRCACGWRAEMPQTLLSGTEYYTERLERIGYAQHEQQMRLILKSRN